MINLASVFSEFKDGKNIDRPTLIRVLEDVFRTLVRKKYGSDENFDVIVNTNGDLEIWHRREIVEDDKVEDELLQISLSDAHQIEEDYELGEECYEAVGIEDFGRRAIQAARQTLVSRIQEYEKALVFKSYENRVGDLISGEVYQILRRAFLIVDEATDTELILPREETIRGDRFRKGEIIKAVIKGVELRNSRPVITLSRTHPTFLERLLEQEVPEIEDGLITIQKIVRIPGERAKVAVESYDDRIDPVGACVGMKGSRIHGIVRELNNENIDIINFTNNIKLLIQRSLTPAKVSSIDLDEENKNASIYLKQNEVSLAIGKGGSNIKLAQQLTDYQIDVYREEEEGFMDDINLDEFNDEIDQWIIDSLKAVGIDTARSVLKFSPEDLAERTDLEVETISEVFEIVKAEFED